MSEKQVQLITLNPIKNEDRDDVSKDGTKLDRTQP